ncbi:hypothetical protein ACHHYP_10807 [Achlya hypogyna]|uniref:Uncharacterized protein n=1 Tax=Achlya hypogyna TaxID=1202772 RepID=A0A1V9YKJ5_ACHHY|nr:hypothetical protein ACHHYP_10807 [Achlya hypogyna]
MASYSVEVSVQTGLLRRWAPRTLALHGQRLSLLDGAQLVDACDLPQAAATLLPSTPQGAAHIALTFPSRNCFIIEVANPSHETELLAAILGTRTTTEPKSSAWERLLNTATSVKQRAANLRNTVPSCGVAFTAVCGHLELLQQTFASVAALTPLARYKYLLDLEATYALEYRRLQSSPPISYAHLVLQMDPPSVALGITVPPEPNIAAVYCVCAFCKTELTSYNVHKLFWDQTRAHCLHCFEYNVVDLYYKNRFETTAFDQPLRDIIGQCPHRRCRHRWTLEEMHDIHLLGKSIECRGCGNWVKYETYLIAIFIQENPFIAFDTVQTVTGSYTGYLRSPREIPSDGRWSSYVAMLDAAVAVRQQTLQKFEVSSLKDRVSTALFMVRSHAPGAFPIDLVRAMNTDLAFVDKVVPFIEYWRHPTVVAAATLRYEQFMAVASKVRDCVPTVDIELIWRVHRTMHVQYIKYSRAATKRVLPPFDPRTDVATAYAKTCEVWRKQFKEPYSSYEALGSKKHSRLAARGAAIFPGVDEELHADELPYAAPIGLKTVRVAVIGTPIFDDRVRSAPSTLADPDSENTQPSSFHKDRMIE